MIKQSGRTEDVEGLSDKELIELFDENCGELFFVKQSVGLPDDDREYVGEPKETDRKGDYDGDANVKTKPKKHKIC